jgi:glycosyltransferase 2 family protein
MHRKWLAVAAKAAISILLIWYLLDRVDVTKVVARARTLDVYEAALCLVVLVVQIGLVTLRWWCVARITDTALSLGAALRILVIGMFFNQTLPSSVGGDAVRVWLVTRENIPLGKAVNVVLCDRVLALVVLVGVIGATLPAIYSRVSDEATRTALAALVGIGAVGLIVFLIAGERIADLLRRWRATRPFGDLASDFRRLFTRPAAVSPLILSLAIHLLTVLAVMFLAWGLEIQASFLDGLMIVPTVLLLTTLPISVAGWGVREGAMVAGFGLVGVPADGALALSVLYGLATIVVSLPGGLVWLAGRTGGAPPAPLATLPD